LSLAVADLLRHEHLSGSLLLVAVELRRLVVLAPGAALDLLFLGQQRLEGGVGLLDERCGLLGRRLLARRRR
jgi:hypothetical protein